MSQSRSNTHENALQRSVVDLGDEDLDAEAGRNDSSKRTSSNDGERDLQELPLEALRCREEANLLASDRIGDGLFRLKVLLPDIDLGDTLDAPTNA
jgi:hypothetical protein